MDQLGTQIRSCFDAELKELRRLQRLLSQLRVLLRRTIFRQVREQTVALKGTVSRVTKKYVHKLLLVFVTSFLIEK